MDILSKFPERLSDLMLDRNLSAKELAEKIGVKPTAVTRYLRGMRLPRLETLVALANFFTCSTDFILGISDYSKQTNAKFYPIPEWSTQFKAVLKACECSQYFVQKKTKISWNTINAWINNKTEPLSDNLVKLAKALDCSVDFLIGREK